MKITVFNFFKDDTHFNFWDTFGQENVEWISVAENQLRDCIGCWDCWLKTPGVCIHKDNMVDYFKKIMASDKVVFLFPTSNGFFTGQAKTFIDRLIPLYHPHIDLINGEMMHVYRYEKYPDLDFYYEEEGLTPLENQILEDYCYRMAHHFRTPAYRLMLEGGRVIRKTLLPRDPQQDQPWQTLKSQQKGKVIIYNGSPRGRKGNSPILIQKLIDGMKSKGLAEEDFEIRHLVEQKNHDQWAADFENHSRHLFVFPLYVHSMPGIVMKYFEKLKPLKEKDSVQMSFFVQSGFMEAFQSAYLLPYLSQLSKRLDAVYGGALIKGGMEGIRIRPEKSLLKLFNQVKEQGASYMADGVFDYTAAMEFKKPITMPKAWRLIFKLMKGTGLTNFYWNSQLKSNGALGRSFDRPYSPS